MLLKGVRLKTSIMTYFRYNTKSMNDKTKQIDHLIAEASTHLGEIKTMLDALLQSSKGSEDASEDEKILNIQLTLQYRLNCEDVLSFLLKIDQQLQYFLGIQPQHSAKMNMERLAYALGNEDLKQILNVLALLAGSLSKIIARYKKDHASFSFDAKKQVKQHIITRRLTQLLTKQAHFLEILHKLELAIEQQLKWEAEGPVLDHIAALRGPISQFYQAMLNGLEQTTQLYQEVNKTPVLNLQLNSLLEETKQLIHVMPSIYAPQLHPLPVHLEPLITSEQLEQRASAKRLRPFFG